MERGSSKIIAGAVCVALICALVASQAGATTWDLATDFDSMTTNPSPDGVWSIGYPYDNAVSPYMLYTYTSNYGYLPNAYGWIYQYQTWMGLVKSMGPASDVDCPAGRCGGHAMWGVQWTAPRDTTISIVGGLWIMRVPDLGRQVGIHLAINGVTIINGTYGESNRAVIPGRADGYTSAHPYSLAQAIESTGGQVSSLCNIPVNQGDTVLLATGAGSADFTGCDFTIYESTDTPGTITGTVTDAASGAALQNVRVEVLGTANETLTDANGTYSLSGVAPGYAKLRLTAARYLTGTGIATVTPGQTVTKDFALTKGGEAWDLAADFSQASNPSGDGLWAFGSVNYPDCNGFTEVFPNHVDGYATGELGGTSAGWMSAIDWWVGVCKGGGGALVDLPAGRVGGHTPWGACWTAPKDCAIDLSGGCWMMRESPDRRNGVTISINGAKLVDNAEIPLPSEGVTSAGPFTYSQAIISKGGDPNTLNNIQVNQGDSVWLTLRYTSADDYVGADLTIRESGTQGNIDGIVRSTEDNSALAGVVVQLDGTSYSTTTAGDGSYLLSGVPEGSYTISFFKAGYVSKSAAVAVTAGATVTRSISLNPGRDVWDLAKDFSDVANPTTPGIWTYGSLAADGNSLDPLFTKHVNSYSEHGISHGWVRPDQDWIGLVMQVGTSAGFDMPEGRVGGHSSTGCRWTAPKDCTINITGAVWNQRTMDPPRTVGVTLSINGTKLIDNLPVPQPGEGVTSASPFSLAQAIINGGGQVSSLTNITVHRGDNIYLGLAGITNADYMGIDFRVTEATDTPSGEYGIGDVKKAGPGWYCTVKGIVVGAFVDSNSFALEDEQRTAAIMVSPMPLPGPEIGDEVSVIGYLEDDGTLHAVTISPVTRTGVDLRPVGITNKSIAGAVDNPGVDNTAMLVKSWGKVLADPVTLTNGWESFIVSDGSASPSGPTVLVAANAPGTNVVFQDDFSGDKSAWRDDSAATTIDDGKLAAPGGTRTVEIAADYLNTKASVVVISPDGVTIPQFGIMLRYSNTTNFVLAYYAPADSGSPARLGVHDVQNGDFGPTTTVSPEGLNPAVPITLTAEVYNNVCRVAITDGSLSYNTEMSLTRNMWRGLVGLYNDLPALYDSFKVFETTAELQVPADALQVLVPPSLVGVVLPAEGDFVSISGVAGKGYTMGGNLRAIAVRLPSDIRPH